MITLSETTRTTTHISPEPTPGLRGRVRLAVAKALNDSGTVALIAGLLTGLVALINIASALTPDIHWRGHLLLQVEGVGTVRFFHALALPVGTALLLSAPYLVKRRRRALRVAAVILIAVGFINILKGLDLEESVAGWLLAGALIATRKNFDVVQPPITLRSAIWRAPVLGALGIVLVTLANWIASDAQIGRALSESSALLRGREDGPIKFESHTAMLFHHRFQFAWIPLAVHLLEIGTLVSIAYVIFRPLAGPTALPGKLLRRRAAEVVRTHGSDTLSFFKLRQDNHFFFNHDRSAFVGYKVDSKALILSGNPVGPSEAFPELLQDVRAFARTRGLRLGAIGVSESLCDLYRDAGMKTIYLGDEAIVDTRSFSLEGRAIRKVRQSVNRLIKNGYSAELSRLAGLDGDTLAGIERVMEAGRQGKPEIGFSMGMDSIHGDNDDDTQFLVARDGDGVVRGMLHLVPCYGRSAVSLSLMRRDPATPNGLMEFLIVEAIGLLRDCGVEELSLNFATGARYIHEPTSWLERWTGKLVIFLDQWLQLESLYRFNAKFNPRWEPRYFTYESYLGFPRTAMAAIWLEGQLPKPRLPRPTLRRRPRYIGRATADTG